MYSKCSNHPVQVFQFLGGILMAGLLTGCAWTQTPVNMTLVPKIDQPLKDSSKAALKVAPVADTRSVADKSVLIQKQNAYGNTTGAYVTQKPVAEIFSDGLKTALKQGGFETTNGTQYVLGSTIQGFDTQIIEGFWQGTLIAKVTVRFELVNQTNQLPVWHDTYTGQNRVQAAFGTGQLVADSFSRASEDVIQQLINDRTFRSYFSP